MDLLDAHRRLGRISEALFNRQIERGQSFVAVEAR